MTLTLTLSPELEQRLSQEAAERGLTMAEYALRLLDQHLPHVSPSERRKMLAEAMQSWLEDDPEEQRETGEYLIRALDEDRLSERKLFPEELRGITW